MDMMEIRRSMMGVIAQMASGKGYEKIYTGEVTVNTDSTSTVSVASINLPEKSYTSDKLLYVKIRDKAGKRSGYFYGQDGVLANPFPANNQTSAATFGNTYTYSVNTNNAFAANKTAFGVYPSGLTSAGVLSISARYNSTYTGIINGTFTVDVYLVDWIDNNSPFK